LGSYVRAKRERITRDATFPFTLSAIFPGRHDSRKPFFWQEVVNKRKKGPQVEEK
jgi:hypothetical protein